MQAGWSFSSMWPRVIDFQIAAGDRRGVGHFWLPAKIEHRPRSFLQIDSKHPMRNSFQPTEIRFG
jgi:hypothetical protein